MAYSTCGTPTYSIIYLYVGVPRVYSSENVLPSVSSRTRSCCLIIILKRSSVYYKPSMHEHLRQFYRVKTDIARIISPCFVM